MSHQNERPLEKPSALISGAGMLSLIAVALVSLYPPFGTALFGPPVYPFALATFLLLIIFSAALVGLRWRSFPSQPERWVIPFALAISASLWLSPFTDRAAFPALSLALLPASIIVITRWIAETGDGVARSLHLFRIAAVVTIGVSIWGLLLWSVVEYGAVVGKADQISQLTGLPASFPNLLEIPNAHPFGHKNFVAGFTLLTLPIVIVLLAVDRSRLRMLWLGGLPIVFVYLLSAESRGGWLGLAVGAGFYLIVRLLESRDRRPSWWLLPLLLVIISIPFLASPRLRESVQRVSQEETLSAIDPYRWEMGKTGFAVGNAYPASGVGPGALSLVSPEHDTSRRFPVVYQVHSTPLQLYAETGLLGVAAFLLLSWGLFRQWKTPHEHVSSTARHLRHASATALVGYAAMALTDYQLDVPLIVLAMSIPAGAIFALGGHSAKPCCDRLWRNVTILTALLLLPLIWFNIKSLLARHALTSALEHLKNNDVEAFASAARQAHRHAPEDPFYLNQWANGWMTQWLAASDPNEKNVWAEKTRQVLARSLEIAPAQDSVHFNLGLLLRYQENHAAALAAFQAALEDNPRKRFAWLLSGESLLALGQPEAAATAFARELRVHRSSVLLPLWQNPELRPHLEARNREYLRLDAANSVSPIQRYLFHWATGTPNADEDDLRDLSAGSRVLIVALEGDPEAAIAIAPLTPQALLVQAWAEPPHAERWLQAAFLQATGRLIDKDDVARIQDLLAETETFESALRLLLEDPTSTQLPNPRASGLFERNFTGAPLYDYFPYEEPIILPLLQ